MRAPLGIGLSGVMRRVKAGIFDWYCVDLEQGRLSSRDVPFGPDEGSAWQRCSVWVACLGKQEYSTGTV